MDFWNNLSKSVEENISIDTSHITEFVSQNAKELSDKTSNKCQEISSSINDSNITGKISENARELSDKASNKWQEIGSSIKDVSIQDFISEAVKRGDQIKSAFSFDTDPLRDALFPPNKAAVEAVASQELDAFGVTEELRVFVRCITLNPSTDLPLAGNRFQNWGWRSIVFKSCYGTFLVLNDDGKMLTHVDEGSDGSIPQNAVWNIGNQELQDKGILMSYSTQAKQYDSCTRSFDLPAIQLISNYKKRSSDKTWRFRTSVGDYQPKIVRSDRDYSYKGNSKQIYLAALSDGTIKMRANAECWEHPDGNHNWIILFSKPDLMSLILPYYQTSDDDEEDLETYEIKRKVPIERPSKSGSNKDVHVHNKYVMILNSSIGSSCTGDNGASSSIISTDINRNINESGTQTIGDVSVKSTVFGFGQVSVHFNNQTHHNY